MDCGIATCDITWSTLIGGAVTNPGIIGDDE